MVATHCRSGCASSDTAAMNSPRTYLPASHARAARCECASGTADETLRSLFGAVRRTAFHEDLAALQARVQTAPIEFERFVPLTPLQAIASDEAILRQAGFVELPKVSQGAKRATHFAKCSLRGYDPALLAHVALDRATAITGAISIFAPYVKVDGPTVIALPRPNVSPVEKPKSPV